jgi:hypothetical protein
MSQPNPSLHRRRACPHGRAWRRRPLLTGLSLLLLLAASTLAASDFVPPDGSVVSKTAGLLMTSDALWSLQGKVGVTTTTALAAGGLRPGIIVTIGDGTDAGSRRMLFKPVTVFPSCSWYERGRSLGPTLTIGYYDYLRMGGRSPILIGADWCRWLGAPQQVKCMYREYQGGQCYRLVECFPEGQSLEAVNLSMTQKEEQEDAELWCLQLETFCSLIPGVNTAVVMTDYPFFSRQVLTSAVGDLATIIPGAVIIRGGVVSLQYVKGTLAAVELGLGALDFVEAKNNQDRLVALLGIAGGVLDAADTYRVAKAGPNLQRPSGQRESRMYSNLVGDPEKAALGMVNPTTGQPISNAEGFIISSALSGASSFPALPKRAPATTDVRAYLQNYVSTLPEPLRSNILGSDEWRYLQDAKLGSMVFADPSYAPIVTPGGTVQFKDSLGGVCTHQKGQNVAMYMNPNWPDQMILVNAFHESSHAWWFASDMMRARDSLIVKRAAYNNFNIFYGQNKEQVMRNESLAQIGSGHFQLRLQDWGMNFGESDVMIPAILSILNDPGAIGNRRLGAIQTYLWGYTSYGQTMEARMQNVFNRIMREVRDDTKWPNGPANPADRFVLFDKAYFHDPVPSQPPKP